MADEASALLEDLRGFLLPEGAAAAEAIHRVRICEKGQMRMSGEARWLSFTSEQTISARVSAFRWEARTSGVVITDAYHDGHGLAMSQLAGLLTLKKATRGPELDRGEMQRYLSSLMLCPAAVVNHPSLAWSVTEDRGLTVRDRHDTTNASVHIYLDDEAGEIICRTIRPRLVGKMAVDTLWMGKGGSFRLWRGMRVAHTLEVWWEIVGAPFCYYRSEVTGIEAVG